MQVTSPVKRNISWGPNSRREPSLLPLHQSPHQSPKNSISSIPTINRNHVLRTTSMDGLVTTVLRRGTKPRNTRSRYCQQQQQPQPHSQQSLPQWLPRSILVIIGLIVPTLFFLHWDHQDILIHSLPKQQQQASHLRRYAPLRNMPPTIQDIDLLNEQLCQSDGTTDAMLEWLRQQKHNTVQWNQFNAQGMVLLAETQAHELFLPVVSLDSLHQFPETYHLIQRIQNYYKDVEYQVFQPAGFTEKRAFDQHFGNIWRKDRPQYDALTIREPLERALEQVSVYVTAATQETHGESLRCFELDNAGRLKVNPLTYWTNAQIWSYVKAHRVPYNPLYDHGYSEIGDEMLTFKTKSI